MDEKLVSALFGVVTGGLTTLGATWLQAHLTRGREHAQSLTETKRAVYGRLLAAVRSEKSYPVFRGNSVIGGEQAEQFNARLEEWRANRRQVKGMAAEAQLLAGEKLRKVLDDFISSNNPEYRLVGAEALMRKEIEV